jgi:hypothetical protein
MGSPRRRRPAPRFTKEKPSAGLNTERGTRGEMSAFVDGETNAAIGELDWVAPGAMVATRPARIADTEQDATGIAFVESTRGNDYPRADAVRLGNWKLKSTAGPGCEIGPAAINLATEGGGNAREEKGRTRARLPIEPASYPRRRQARGESVMPG